MKAPIASQGDATARRGPTAKAKGRNGQRLNRLLPEDRPAHEWYRFVLSFPPHLVRDYLERFGIGPQHRVLDPFCGTGTTLVECKKHGIASVVVEANPMAHFASDVKVDWAPDPEELIHHAAGFVESAKEIWRRHDIDDE